MAIYLDATKGVDAARQEIGNGRVEAEGFLDAGGEVGA